MPIVSKLILEIASHACSVLSVSAKGSPETNPNKVTVVRRLEDEVEAPELLIGSAIVFIICAKAGHTTI